MNSSTGNNSMGSKEATEPKRLTIRELDEITDNFSAERLIGRGGYGTVYKGVLDDGEEVAVKILHNNVSDSKDEEFKHEFDNLMMLRHPNIVRLVGYCFETQRQHMDFQGRPVFAETTCRALCFEYMHKGSLQGQLYDESHGLDWKARYKIIKGACEGLKYLHGLREPIYHLDLKPDNILLDENLRPQLADFGLSKLCGAEQTLITQNVTRTRGYMPEEYLFRGLVSNKVDIFSLGVVITKIIAGPGGQTRSAEIPNQEFLDQVHENWRTRLEASCTSTRVLEAYCEQVSICTEIGLSSMEYDRHNRPNIVQIINKLDETETMVEKAILNSRSSMQVKSQRETDDLVKVEAFARNKAIHVTETCHDFPVLVRVTAPWRCMEMPIDVYVDVIVVSNIGMDQVNEAVMALIDRLNPNDRLSILFCGRNGCEQVMELTYMFDHGQDFARLKINELAQSHVKEKCTYCGPALPMAAEILRQRGVEESCSRRGCIMNMWTGRMVPEIHKQDISKEFPVHTIAIGEHDSDMSSLCGMTSGSYSVNKYPYEAKRRMESRWDHNIPQVKRKSLIITLRADEGVTISSIASAFEAVSDKQSATVFISSINGGQQKTFIVYLTVPRGKEKLVTIGGWYGGKELVGMDVVVQRPHRKCTPDEVIIHPKLAAELLRARLKEGIINKLNRHDNRDRLLLLLDEIDNSDKGKATPEEILADLEEEVAQMMNRTGFGSYTETLVSLLNRRQLQGLANNNTHPDESAFFIQALQRANACTNFVKVEGFTRSKAVMYYETYAEFQVLVRVTVAPWRHGWEMPRHGVDVVAVLDMQGERLELVKQAMMIVIDKLGHDDRLSIVPFQTRKHRLMELTYMSDDHDYGRDAARFKINHLKASSGRYLGDIARAALEDGAQILRHRGAQESRTRPGCMILLSDGQYPGILQIKIRSEFPVHTFGLGANHNPEAMKYVADMTSGTYSFVDQAISNIKDALALFITGFTSIAVRSITINISAHQDIGISSIESGNYIHKVNSSNMTGTIIIEHMYAGEQKDFVVNLVVGRGTHDLMTISGHYILYRQEVSLPTFDMSVERPWLTRHDLTINPDVAAELTRIRLQNGVLDMLEKQKMSTQELQQLWNMIKHSDEGCGAPEKTLSDLSMDVAEMKRDILGMPYTLSWLSCQKWQRATTKGTPNNSSAFRTKGQYADEDTNLVKVKTFTRSKAIPSDDPCNKFPVLVRVMAGPWWQAEEMLCVDVVAVLDARAGMQGEKLERMKEAMMVVIGKLRAEDRLSIVSFNTYENRLTGLTYMTDHGRNVARLKIKKLVASGQGDAVAALREGAEILWWREAHCSRRIGCIVFMSDCKNNEIFGTDIRPEFPVHSFNLGTEHNPGMMKYIAEITSGTYSFIAEDIGMMKDALALFITGLTSVAAMSIKITLRTNEGITMSSIVSGGYVNHVENNEFGTIDIDNIYAGERKDFIVYLRVAESKKDLMTIGGQYLTHNTVKHLAYTDVVVQRPHHEGLQDDLAIHPEVAAEFVRIMLEKGITSMVEKGLSIIGLQQLWEEIMDTDEGHGAPAETISGLSMDIAEMKRDIENPKEYRKTGLPYTLAWLTSRRLRRATIKGTPSNSDAFRTTGQDTDGKATLSQ